MNIIEILKKTQEELKEYTCTKLRRNGYRKIVVKEDFVYAKGDIPVLLVAHLDIVHKAPPTTILYDTRKQMLWSPTGIGGDDRCGVYAILEITKKYKPYVLFTTDEETGASGARAFVKEVDELPVNFVIEIDRRGFQQAVFYECGNKDFQKFITSYGFRKEYGSFTDISIISPAYDVASVNLSAGYYNEHTLSEYISLKDLQYTIDGVANILRDVKQDETINAMEFDYQEVVYSYPYIKDVKKETTATDKTGVETDDKQCDIYDKWLKIDYDELGEEEFEYVYGIKRPATYEEFIEKYDLL